MNAISVSLLLSLILLLGFPQRSDAYLDPASGSMILQMAVGGALAAMAVVKVYWRRIRAFFRRPEAKEGLPQ